MCGDGSCAANCDSTVYFGCPASTPVLCPNGDCVADSSACLKANCTGYYCYNGVCESDAVQCPIAPRLVQVVPTVVDLPSSSSATNQTYNVSVLTANGAVVVEVVLPRSLLSNVRAFFFCNSRTNLVFRIRTCNWLLNQFQIPL